MIAIFLYIIFTWKVYVFHVLSRECYGCQRTASYKMESRFGIFEGEGQDRGLKGHKNAIVEYMDKTNGNFCFGHL